MSCIGKAYCPHCKEDKLGTCLCMLVCPTCSGKMDIPAWRIEEVAQMIKQQSMDPVLYYQTPNTQRKYLPTLAELIDRMSICILKSVFIPENKPAYDKEVKDIEHDIDLLLNEAGNKGPLNARAIKAILVVMLSNRYIWENESLCRKGDNQDFSLLKKTHSINGVRNTAKNEIAVVMGERKDLKVDCLAAELLSGAENWDIFKL